MAKRQINVMLSELGGTPKVLQVDAGTTVAQLIDKDGDFDCEGSEIRMNAAKVGKTTRLTNNAVVTVIPRVEGGR